MLNIRCNGQIWSFGLVLWSRIFGHLVFIYSVFRFWSNVPTSIQMESKIWTKSQTQKCCILRVESSILKIVNGLPHISFLALVLLQLQVPSQNLMLKVQNQTSFLKVTDHDNWRKSRGENNNNNKKFLALFTKMHNEVGHFNEVGHLNSILSISHP